MQAKQDMYRKSGRSAALSFKILLAICLVEFVVMVFLHLMGIHDSTALTAALDALLLSLVSLPVLYFWIIKPFVRKIEKALARLNEHEFALNNHTIFAETDTKGTILDVNDMFCSISGYSREELIGKNHRILNSGYHPVSFWTEMYRTVAQKKVWHGEVCNRKKSGEKYWLRTTIVPITDESGKVVRYIALRTDITEIILQRDQINTALGEVRTLKAYEAKMFAVIAHEMRTPAASIAMLLENHEEYSQDRLVSLLKDNATHLLSVMDDLKAVANPNALQVKEGEPVDIVKSVRSVIQSLGDKFKRYHIRPHFDEVGCDELKLEVNGKILRQVVSNLIKNAVLHSQAENLWVEVLCHEIDERHREVEIRVIDDGVGVSEEYRERAFEAFERGITNAPGTGIGLSVSRDLARMQKGDVYYTPRDEGGSIFNYRFVAKVIDQDSDPIIEADLNSDPLQSMRVLVIEDNPTIVKVTRAMLEKHGAIVETAENGKQGVDLFKDKPFDLVLTDIMMPEMDGYEVAKMLRKDGFTGPVIAVSAATIGNELDRMIDAGANAVIAKPFKVTDLLKALFSMKQHV